MTRRINAAGLALVKQWDGLKTKAYRDITGIWTVGYGHTSSADAPMVTSNMVITEAEAEAILRADLAEFEERVSRLVKVPLTENQHTVLVSFDFDTGELHSSTLLKKLNKGYDGVPAELMKWVNAGGKRVKGLVSRRSVEAKGEFVSSNIVPAAPKAPVVVTKENVSWAAGILSTIAFAFTGNGPLQWALAGILVVAFGIGAFLFIRFIRNRLDPA